MIAVAARGGGRYGRRWAPAGDRQQSLAVCSRRDLLSAVKRDGAFNHPGGLARFLGETDPRVLAHQRTASVVVVVPTLNEAPTIASIVGALVALREAGAIDRVLVFDDSSDATPQLAEHAGGEVVRQRDVCPGVGEVLGKGDAMWRALAVCEEEIVVYVDGDTRNFSASMACDLAAAVALRGAQFAKGAYRRPWSVGGQTLPTGGGRVTELTAKPLLAAFAPELRAFEQPLAGEIAARAELLRALPFATGYGVDVALLIDAWRHVGIDGLAEVRMRERQNRHRPLEQLAPMAHAVTQAILHRTGVAPADLDAPIDRPAMQQYLLPAAA